MEFRTPITITPHKIITHEKRFLLMGSCFAEHIGQKLRGYHFKGDINPFGILYNPSSIANALNRLLIQKPFTTDELFEHHGLYHSWMHHGNFSAETAEQTLENINQRWEQASKNLSQTDILIITFGSSWIYEFKGQTVGNCHKVPEKQFNRRRLTVTEIVAQYTELLDHLIDQKPDLQIILSVSPVRYLGHSGNENQTNKAILLLAAEALCAHYKQTIYFPAYEILVDELRDYRFFADDMIHPSATAIDYVWECFSKNYFASETRHLLPEIDKLKRALEHRPIHEESTEYQEFKKRTEAQIAQFKKQFPHIDLA